LLELLSWRLADLVEWPQRAGSVGEAGGTAEHGVGKVRGMVEAE
jgi:hypothetical protein